MSRHRNVRNLDYDAAYDDAYDDSIYGHSLDDHDCASSPTSAELYMYNNAKDNDYQFGAFFPSTNKIVEEGIDNKDESYACHRRDSSNLERSRLSSEDDDTSHEYRRRDSSNFERPRLSSEDDIKLNSVLDEIRNVVGDQYSEARLIETVLEHKFDYETSLNALLTNQLPSASNEVPIPSLTKQKVSTKRQRAIVTNPANRGGPSALSSMQSSHSPLNSSSSSHLQTAEGRIAATPLQNFPSSGFKCLENGMAKIKTTEESQSIIINGDDDCLAEVNIKEKEPELPPPKLVKIRDKAVDIEKLYLENREACKELLNLVVVGHVDAGKSTLMGHLLYLQGDVPQRMMHKYEQESKKMGKQSFMYAWVLDDTDEERSRGVTVDIAQRSFETETKMINLLDAPGHRDFIPNMITGAARADVSILVVDASTGGFEAGFESGGQTREHAILVKSLGISQLTVVVNKLDTVDWNENRFNDVKSSLRQFLKTVGFRESDVIYVPCSGLTGENLITPSEIPELKSWYKGPTVLKAIDQMKMPQRVITKPVRICISDAYKGSGSITVVAGKLVSGYTQTGDRLMLMPQNEIVLVKGVQNDSGNLGSAFAGDLATLNLTGVDTNVVHVGDFLCDPTHLITQATRIEARIVVFNVTVPIIRGIEFDFHYQSVSEECKLSKLVAILHKNSGQVTKLRPRALLKSSNAVVELSFARPLSIEVYKDYKDLGRFMLRSNGATVAAGMVTKIVRCTNVL